MFPFLPTAQTFFWLQPTRASEPSHPFLLLTQDLLMVPSIVKDFGLVFGT